MPVTGYVASGEGGFRNVEDLGGFRRWQRRSSESGNGSSACRPNRRLDGREDDAGVATTGAIEKAPGAAVVSALLGRRLGCDRDRDGLSEENGQQDGCAGSKHSHRFTSCGLFEEAPPQA